MITNKCRRCGKEFQTKNRNVLYCTKKCRAEALQARGNVRQQLAWMDAMIKSARKSK